MSSPVLAVHAWPTNAHLIADVARVGYLHRDWVVLDPTYGTGTWWRRFRPRHLIGSDIDPARSPVGQSVDFTSMPYQDRAFDAVAFDPPYKLNGTPTAAVDSRYGVDVPRTREERHDLIVRGIKECARVLAPRGFLLVKCQDQVNGGKVRWQTDLVTDAGSSCGLDKVDAFHMLAYRPQPAGTIQEHARRNHSTLIVFRGPK